MSVVFIHGVANRDSVDSRKTVATRIGASMAQPSGEIKPQCLPKPPLVPLTITIEPPEARKAIQLELLDGAGTSVETAPQPVKTIAAYKVLLELPRGRYTVRARIVPPKRHFVGSRIRAIKLEPHEGKLTIKVIK